MRRVADKLLKKTDQNPFNDFQGRGLSDKEISAEFYATTTFWGLFNSQHEILVGSRGCGKTFLLKSMRYSMLKKMVDQKAKTLVLDKHYIALYVPMHLEYLTAVRMQTNKEMKDVIFRIFFNGLLISSLIDELEELLKEIEDDVNRVLKEIELSKELGVALFGNDSAMASLAQLRKRVRRMLYSLDVQFFDPQDYPAVFRREIPNSLVVAKSEIEEILGLENITWIVCVDEAEFLDEQMLKCINSVFRSDSEHIAIKMATLPFYHSTLETDLNNISVAEGHDFTYKMVDFKYDDVDYINLTNKVVDHRISSLLGNDMQCKTLEDFVGRIGDDKGIDYYRLEFGEEAAKSESIYEDIISEFSEERRLGAQKYKNIDKTITNKYAPVLYVRKMFKRSKQGNSKVGWYAGADMIRRISGGNPRLFLRIMSILFNKAISAELTPKVQSEAIYSFSKYYCEGTKSIRRYGPLMYRNLKSIGDQLLHKVHYGPLLTNGNGFRFQKRSNVFDGDYNWLKEAIAYGYIFVDESALRLGLTRTTKFILSGPYSVYYWLPMRSDTVTTVHLNDKTDNTYTVNYKQLSFLGDINDY